MPFEKESNPHSRATLIKQRTQARNTYCKLMTAIKQHNQNNEPIGFKKLCELIDHHIVSRFIREAEAWGMLESYCGETDGRVMGRLLKVTLVGDAFIEYCEQKTNHEK
jgi:hypothetical protein